MPLVIRWDWEWLKKLRDGRILFVVDFKFPSQTLFLGQSGTRRFPRGRPRAGSWPTPRTTGGTWRASLRSRSSRRLPGAPWSWRWQPGEPLEQAGRAGSCEHDQPDQPGRRHRLRTGQLHTFILHIKESFKYFPWTNWTSQNLQTTNSRGVNEIKSLFGKKWYPCMCSK